MPGALSPKTGEPGVVGEQAQLRRGPFAPRHPLATLALLVALLAAPAVSSGATEARQFMGMNSSDLPFNDGAEVNKALAALRKRGVGTVRFTVYWSGQQPYATWSDVPEAQRSRFVDVGGRPTDYGPTDKFVAAAAAQGLQVLPTIIGVPRWASTDPSQAFAPPKDPVQFGDFGGALARRYGTKGSFWRENPNLSRLPIRVWQIWNEPAGFSGFGDWTGFWSGPLAALTTYKAMVKASRKAIRRADEGRTDHARWLLRPGLDDHGADLRSRLPQAVRRRGDPPLCQDRLRHGQGRSTRACGDEPNGDGNKPVVVTEFGWTSSSGSVPSAVPAARFLETTEDGQASLLRRGYRALWKRRGELRLRAAYWYTWATPGRSLSDEFDYAGLYRLRDNGSFVAKPSADSYRKVALELSGR